VGGEVAIRRKTHNYTQRQEKLMKGRFLASC